VINDEYKVIFVHIPLTGGHSIKSLFGGKSSKYLTPPNKIGPHGSPKLYKERFPEQWRDYYRFTMVRNPWDRLVSAWSKGQTRSGKIKNLENFKKIKNQFTLFVKRDLRNMVKSNKYRLLYPQSFWLDDEIDYVGCYEKFKESVNLMLDKFDIKKDIPYIFKSIRLIDYQRYYTKETESIIRNIYRRDIKEFHYIL